MWHQTPWPQFVTWIQLNQGFQDSQNTCSSNWSGVGPTSQTSRSFRHWIWVARTARIRCRPRRAKGSHNRCPEGPIPPDNSKAMCYLLGTKVAHSRLGHFSAMICIILNVIPPWRVVLFQHLAQITNSWQKHNMAQDTSLKRCYTPEDHEPTGRLSNWGFTKIHWAWHSEKRGWKTISAGSMQTFNSFHGGTNVNEPEPPFETWLGGHWVNTSNTSYTMSSWWLIWSRRLDWPPLNQNCYYPKTNAGQPVAWCFLGRPGRQSWHMPTPNDKG